MKHKGSICEHNRQRNREILAAYRKALSCSSRISLPDVCRSVAESPCSRFWVSEGRAAVVVARMLRGDSLPKMSRLKREMFSKIFEKTVGLMRVNPDISISEATAIAVNQPAEKFYLKPGSIREVIYLIRKGKCRV